MINTIKILSLSALLFTFGCATDLPIKNIHENTTETVNSPQNAPINTTPAPQPVPPTTGSESVKTEHKEEIKLTDLELQKFSYELGFDPKKDLSEEQKQQILDRKKNTFARAQPR